MKVLLILITSFIFCNYAYSLDWKTIHEAADKTTVIDIEKNTQAKSLENLYLSGLVYLNAYEDDKADQLFKEMLLIDYNSTEAHWGIAEVLRRKYELSKSQKMLSDIIKKDPNFSPAYINLAFIKYNLKDYTEAVRLTSTVIKQGKDNVDLSNFVRAHLVFAGAKGLVAHFGGPIIKMLYGTQIFPNLKKAQDLLPDSAEVYLGLGAFYLLAPAIVGGDLQKAEEYLKKAIELDPKLTDAYVRLGQVYKVKGDDKQFNDYIDKALAIDPKNFLANDIKSKTCSFICIDSK